MNLYELQRNLKGFDIRQEVVEVIRETAPDIIKLNQGQLFIGRRADGHEIEPEYTEATIAIKEGKGQPTDRVTLKDTGDFWHSIIVDKININTYNIFAEDKKTAKLIKKYGSQILGLSKESRTEEYTPLYFFPALKARIERKTGLKLT